MDQNKMAQKVRIFIQTQFCIRGIMFEFIFSGIDGTNAVKIRKEFIKTKNDLEKFLKESKLKYTTAFHNPCFVHGCISDIMYEIIGNKTNSSDAGIISQLSEKISFKFTERHLFDLTGNGSASGLGGSVGHIYLSVFDNLANLEIVNGKIVSYQVKINAYNILNLFLNH